MIDLFQSRFRRMSRTLWGSWPLILLITVIVSLEFGADPLRLMLRYARPEIVAGQWWRLFTGNFVHLGWWHVGLDLGGITLLWILVGDVLSGWRWILATLAGAWGVGLGLWWAWPHVIWYVGISGVAHTYWAAGALLLFTRRRWEGGALLALLAMKLGWEQAVGPLPSSSDILHEPIVTSAHLIGAITGVMLALAFWVFPRVHSRFLELLIPKSL